MAEPFRETPTSPGDAWRPPAQQEQTDGWQLPGYTDFVRVSAGTGSRVYRAWQSALDRPVAVKVLHLDDPEAIKRFEREIDITVQLGRRHPNIVTVLDIGSTGDGRPCIVMEYCDGGSLHDRLRAHGPLPPDEVLDAGIVVADALTFAHGQGVLHRDVKPQNILVLPTSYVLADFGIARRADASQHTASVDWFTFQHASPQVIDGETPDEQDDIWSVGSTLFTLLDGRPPHAGNLPEDNKPLAYMRRVRTAAARPLNRTDMPAGLSEIIARCLRPDRAERFATAADLRDALKAVQAQQRAWAPGALRQMQALGAIVAQEIGQDDTGRQGTGGPGTGPQATGGHGTRQQGTGGLETGGRGSGPQGVGQNVTGSPGTGQHGTGGYVTGSPGTGQHGTGGYGTGVQGTGSRGLGQWAPAPGDLPPGQLAPGQQAPPGVQASPGQRGAPEVQGQPETFAPPARGRVASQGVPLVSSNLDGVGSGPESLTMQRPAAPMTPAELANLLASAASAGYPAQGREVVEEPESPPSPLPVFDDGDRRRGLRGRRLAVAAAAALVAGIAAGVIGMLAVKRPGDPAQTNQQNRQQQPQEMSVSSAPRPGGSAEANINDPAIAAELTTVRLSGSSVLLKWRDPTQGKAKFVVVRVEGGQGKPVTALDAGVTETTLEGVQANGPVCYLVISLMEDRRGFSPTKCSGTTSQ